MRRSLVLFTTVFCCGIITASFLKINFWPVYSLAVICLIFSILLIKKKLLLNFSICGVIFLLGVILLKNSKLPPKCNIANYILYKSNSVYIVKGIIDNNPVVRNNRIMFVFKTRELQFNNLRHNCCGDILVYARGIKNLHYGQELIVYGNLYRPFRIVFSGGRSYRDYLYSQGIRAIMNVRALIQIATPARYSSLNIKRITFWLKNNFQNVIYKYLTSIPAAVVDAMVLGDKRNIPQSINNSMIKSGTIHILVVSGFNVGIVGFIIILWLKIIRLPRRLRLFIACLLLIVYCLITGASTPVVRATIMAIVFILSYFVKREPDIYNSMCLAAISILVVNPQQLFDISFQLSFASVISIVYFYPRIKSFLQLNDLKLKYVRFIIDGALVSISAWLGTLGFIAYYFKIISPITVFANLLIVPLASLITLCGFSMVIAGFIWPALARLFASSTELIIILLLNINHFLIKIPGAYFCLSR